MNNMEFLYELKPQYDSAKSFYHKANVYRDNQGCIYLMSYETIVLEMRDSIISPTGETEIIIYNWYSTTTARHINEFLRQNGFKTLSKKQLEGGYIYEKCQC